MGFVYYNPNPANKFVGDCVIRALSKIFNDTWLNVYDDMCLQGRAMFDMPNSNSVSNAYLKSNGFKHFTVPDVCPNCYTVRMFCEDHPQGTFLVATGSHVLAVINGNYYDSGDSGNEVLTYYWRKEN